MYTEVGRAVIMCPQSSIVMEKTLFDGIVYVIGDRIYYNSKYRSMFWCPCTSGSEWFVSDIRNIEVINEGVTVYNPGGPNWYFPMNPGLTITFRDNTALVAAMPDAVNFSLKLRHYQSHPSISSGRIGNLTFNHQPATINQTAGRTEMPEDSDKAALLA